MCFESVCSCPVLYMVTGSLSEKEGLAQTTHSTVVGRMLWLWTAHGSSPFIVRWTSQPTATVVYWSAALSLITSLVLGTKLEITEP